MAVYPALAHAQKVIARMLARNPSTGPAHHYLIIHGEKTAVRNDTDRELAFRQESNFSYLSGCEVPGSAVVINYLHDGGDFEAARVQTKLYLPAVVDEEVMWCGLPPTPNQLAEQLSFTSIHAGWSDATLFPRAANASTKVYVHTLPWTAFNSKLISTINGPIHSTQYLLPALHEARRIKTEREIEIMKRAAFVTKGAHEALMRAVGSGAVTDENEAEAIFVAWGRKYGAKHQAYTPIVAGGMNAGTLHYVSNDLPFPTDAPGAVLLVDAGAEIANYASDITRCIPIGNGGKFTPEAKRIYELVLSMQEAAFALIKPGADWEGIQKLMHDVMVRGFLKLGIFVAQDASASEDANVATIIAAGLSSAFYPHGVGHLLGLDVHDVGGLPNGKSQDPLLKYLRLRVPLEAGFVVTVEPGVYFNEHLFKAFKNSPLVNHAKLAEYWYVGGVRIEDNLLVTADGFENFSKDTAKTVAEVEALTTSMR